jgi:hypothetical protein
MAAEVEVRFTGLCAFGPEETDGAGARSRSVMLVNARDGHHTEPHVAAVLVPFASFDNSGRDYDFRFDGRLADFGPHAEDMVGFILKGEQLSLVGLDNASLSTVSGPADDAECPNETNREGFGWLASLRKTDNAMPTSEASSGRRKSLLLARLRLDKGRLGTERFVEQLEQGKIRIVRWRHLDQGKPQLLRAVAEVAKLSGISTASDRLRIHSERFPSEPPEPPPPVLPDIILKRGTGPDKIYAWFVNMPMVDIVGPDRTPGGNPPSNLHFHHQYRLTNRPNGTIPQPERLCDPTNEVTSRSREAASNPKCPPTSFE